MSGIVFDIQRGAMQDGPGIRTTVFLKGCPLRCQWCHNPESWSAQPQCVQAPCPKDPPTLFGREISVEDVLREVRKDKAYYESSGGGLSISGGEPTMQPEFCLNLLKAARSEGIHTALDTCGYIPKEVLLKVIPYVDLFLWDYKATGAPLHQSLTGVLPDLILENFETLYQKGASILLRCPLIPGVNDSPDHFKAIASYALDYPHLAGIEILPYHTIGLSKYDRLGIPRPKLVAEAPGEELKQRWRSYFKELGCRKVTVA